ncbi:hypothetical protein K1719_012373 [Acacia pycnantha]|nr:hypothetical protein K1719_012373 [Acacia pycnantha]
MVVPESNLKLYERQGVHMTDKENLHPRGDVVTASRLKVDGLKDLNPNGAEAAHMDDISMVMEELLVWNCRGAASRGVASVIRDNKHQYKLDMVALLEPRISGNQAKRVIKKWDFKHSVRREAEGFSGGIWLLWDSNELSVDVRIMHEQFIHCKVSIGEEEMLVTILYASPTEQKRHRLWEALYEMACEISEPWVLVGDFNEIRTPSERSARLPSARLPL